MIEIEKRLRDTLSGRGASFSSFTAREIGALLADRDEREAKLRAEIERLRDLLRVEQALALRQDPFRCYDIECEWFGRPVRAGDCQCHHLQATTHRSNVRDALAAKENNDAAR